MKALLIGLIILGVLAAGVAAIRINPAQKDTSITATFTDSMAQHRSDKAIPDLPTVIIKTGAKTVEVRVELSVTPEQWSVGLMRRSSLTENTGMLFVFPDEAVRVFWMKDTLMPLDVIFVDESGKIVSLKTMTPCLYEAACPTYESDLPARYALEVAAGFAAKHGLKPGQVMALPRLNGSRTLR
ncbi:DUF192 domain-containing protein [Candidatus Parcubacteria bacterium]|nr:DUF192 domain-containing protein [Candidatus Parcubacteria bacterium]